MEVVAEVVVILEKALVVEVVQLEILMEVVEADWALDWVDSRMKLPVLEVLVFAVTALELASRLRFAH